MERSCRYKSLLKWHRFGLLFAWVSVHWPNSNQTSYVLLSMLSARGIRPCDTFSFYSSSLQASFGCLKQLKNTWEFSNTISTSSSAFTLITHRPSSLKCSFMLVYAFIHTYIHTYRQTDRQTDRQTNQ